MQASQPQTLNPDSRVTREVRVQLSDLDGVMKKSVVILLVMRHFFI